jgi:20S proteasome alpha/beta subunit
VTTIIGIWTHDSHVILASDQQATQERGDPGSRPPTRQLMKKIHIANDGSFAAGMSGIYDDYYVSFLTRLLAGEIKVDEATKRGYCQEFQDLNLGRWGRRAPTGEMNHLLLATRYGTPALYQWWPLGLVELSGSDAIGSGAVYARQMITERRRIPERMTATDGLDLALNALQEANRDLYTNGLDLVIISQKGIREYGHQLRAAAEMAKQGQLKQIKADLAKP